MTAFDPTPLRPDAPALPSMKAEMPSEQRLAYDPNAKPTYHHGLTARQHAAIALCIPDSGCDWLDAMINRRRRDEIAAKAMPELMANMINPNVTDVAAWAFKHADAMLAASNKEPE